MSGKFLSACGSVGVFAAVCVCVYFGQRTCKYLLCLSSAKKRQKIKAPKKAGDKQKGFNRRQLEVNADRYFLS